MGADKFQYTCMGGEIAIEGVDDKKDMEETRRTFSLLGKKKQKFHLSDCYLFKCDFYISFLSASAGLNEDFQFNVLKVLAAILHLGNAKIKDSGDGKSSVPVSLTSASPKLHFACDIRS